MAADTSNLTALIRRNNDTELMPPPPLKRIKRPKNVIDEESYTSAISEIIARDFFPGLLESETQQEYMDALDSGDAAWISSASRRLSHIMTPGRQRGRRGTSLHAPSIAEDTPKSFVGDTPISVVSGTTTVSQPDPVEVDTNLSLDNFQARYTSEDNESFYKLLDKQNQKRAEKYAWMWTGNKMPSKMMLKQKEVEFKLLESRTSLQNDGFEKKRLAIQDADDRPARPDAWKTKPNNGLVFRPEGVEDSLVTVAQKAQNESRAAPKAVVYENTRMPVLETLHAGPGIASSPSLSAVKDAISGRHRVEYEESGFDGTETPRVNGYAFVDDEPVEEPYSPTPVIDLGKGDAVKNPFVIKEQSKREDLHHRMVDKVARAKRTSQKVGMTGRVDTTPIPKFPSSPRVGGGNLTPAAQRLWSRVGNSSSSSPVFGAKTTGTTKPRQSFRSPWSAANKQG